MGRLSESDRTEIIRRYKDGESTRALAKEFGCSKNTILKMIEREGVEKHSRSFANRRGYSVNEYAFDVITPDSAYWIGFLMADGCVQKSNTITICLSEKDTAHLEKFKEFLGSTNKIHTQMANANKKSSKTYLSSRFIVGSIRLCEVLKRYGIVPNKTFIAKASESLVLNKHFWRGVIDGDGCISWHKRVYGIYPRLSLVGSELLLQQFRNFVKKIYPNTNSKVIPNRNIFQIEFCGKAAVAIISELYTNADTALDRKAAAAREVLAFAAERKNKRQKG